MWLENRLRKLEDATCLRLGSEETMPTNCGEFWEMQVEWSALRLVRGLESDFAMDETGRSEEAVTIKTRAPHDRRAAEEACLCTSQLAHT